MRFIRKFLLTFICIIFVFNFNPIYCDDLEETEEVFTVQDEINNSLSEEAFSSNDTSLTLNSRSCIILDRLSGKPLYEKNSNTRVKMASTTKIMTALITLEKADLNETVEVSKKAANTGGSRLGLKTGDKITIRNLLYGLMLCSGNDAAVCLAESLGGSINGFSELMNTKAKELNLTNTNFESPHGLDSDGHYTTAYELALLSDYALKNPTFLKIVGTKNITITINNYSKNITTTNELLGNLNGIYGIKTGFTNGANRCLVTACKRNNMDIICIVLGADTKKFRTQDSIKLIEYSFKNFEYINIENLAINKLTNWENENLNNIKISKSLNNNLDLELSTIEQPLIPIKKDLVDNLELTINMQTEFSAPIEKDSILGTISISSNKELISNFNIITTNDIARKSTIDNILDLFKIYPYSLKTFLTI